MEKAAFLGFGEVNTPAQLIIDKCAKAAADLERAGLDLLKVFPITDDPAEKDIKKALDALRGQEFDSIVVCIAGWIPSHAVVKVCEQ